MSDLVFNPQEFVKDAVEQECLKHGIDEDGMADILWMAALATVNGTIKYRFGIGRTTYGFGGTENDYVHMDLIASTQDEAIKKAEGLSPKLNGSESYGFKVQTIEEKD